MCPVTYWYDRARDNLSFVKIFVSERIGNRVEDLSNKFYLSLV